MFQSLIWLCLAAYAFHILEEFAFDWRSWAQRVLHLPAEWKDFYVTNALVVVVGIVAAEIAPVFPTVALGFPALMLINAACFHVAPFALTRGRFSPGLFTAVLFFFPLAIATFRTAAVDTGAVVLAFGVGALLMAMPVAFLKLKTKPYFDQAR